MGAYDTLLGTLLIGIFFNTYLYGIVCNQFGIYFFSGNFWKKDSWWIRTTVIVLFINDTVHSAAQIYMAWFYCINNYDNPAILAIAPWPYPLTPISGALAAILIHNFMAIRIFRLTHKWFIYVGVMIAAVGVFGCGMAVGVRAWIIHEVQKLIILKPLIITWLVGQTMIDLFLTCTMTVVLYRSRTGFHNTDTVINRLVRGAIQTGLFASIFAIALLITYLGSPNTNLYGMFAMPVGRIYTNALMDTLISREDLKEMLCGTIEMTSSIVRDTSRRMDLPRRSNVQIPVVNVRRDVFTETEHDGDLKYESSDTDVFSRSPAKPRR